MNTQTQTAPAPKRFSDLNITAKPKGLLGDKIKIDRVMNREIIVEAFLIRKSKYPDKDGSFPDRLELQFTLNGYRHILFSISGVLIGMIRDMQKEDFPFITTIKKQEDDSFQFT